MHSNRSKFVAVAIVLSVVLGVVLILTRGERSRDLVLSLEPISESDDVTVYVGGAVEEPGLFSLPRGSRVSEALDVAGMLDSSDTRLIDMASVLTDEQSIMVPEIEPENAEASSAPGAASAPAEAVINVNTASYDELQQLSGIGPALAEKIIEWRESEGPFQSLDELSKVAGISERMVDDFRDSATVSR